MGDSAHQSPDARYLATNRANWDERVPAHLASDFYDVEGFKAGRSTLAQVDLDTLGDVSGKTLLHLQCHIGLDTLSWARRGAIVTGLDFSEPALAAARALAEEIGVAARFVCSDLYDASDSLNEQFDIVFTGIGALVWLPDIRRWADVVAACLASGGAFYIRESHPLQHALDDERDDDELRLVAPYFETPEPRRFDDPDSYTGTGATFEDTTTYQWNHGLGEVVTALIDAGLSIDFLHEHTFTEYRALPGMVRGADGLYRLPDRPERLPLMYSILAHKIRSNRPPA